ncbi:tetratricopeptide repeat protein [Winogradskyella sp. PE311]|uniref:tetratricopeptide repeat protein n=1 Tax=Winogradskyella sp. PE311 TaxID=3366943 RepID=UPI00397FB088
MDYKKNKIGDINGNFNKVIQIIFQDGNEVEEKLGTLVDRLIRNERNEIDSLKKRIADKENIIKDKKTIVNLKENEIILLKTTLSEKEKQLEESKLRFAKTFIENNGNDFRNSKELYPKALQLLTSGNKEEALEILNRNELIKEIKKLEKEKEKQSESWLLRADLLKENDEWGRLLDECYEFAVSTYPQWKNTIEAANHYAQIHNYGLAQKYYNKSFNTVESDEERSITLNNYALLLNDQNKPEDALKFQRKALIIDRSLVEKNEEIYLPNLAKTLNNLASTYSSKHNYDKAQVYYNEALEIYKNLSKINPEQYLYYLSGALFNCANTYHKKELFDKAQELYNEALGLHRKLAKAKPKEYLPSLSMILNNFALLYDELNDFEKADFFFSEALEIRKELAIINPRKYLQTEGETLLNLGRLYSDTKVEKSKNYYIESLKIYEELANYNSEKYLPEVGLVLNNLGWLQKLQNDNENAEKNLYRALEIFKDLANNNPTRFIPRLCTTKFKMSSFYQQNKINKNLSIKLATEVVKDILPFVQTAKNRELLQIVCMVLLDWDVDIENLISKTEYNYENTSISCPECSWVPDGKMNWQCTCGHQWDTFLTRGKCFQCKKQWKETYCPKCKTYSQHLDWY